MNRLWKGYVGGALVLSEPVVLMMRVLTDLFFFERTTDVSFFCFGIYSLVLVGLGLLELNLRV